jgi:GNAT superfamily N-acetyltransferase
VTVAITPATSDDIPHLLSILAEMDRFYGATDLEPQQLRERQVTEALFADQPLAYALIARVDGQVAGVASYSFLWPAAGLTTSLYLKELYVAEAHRRDGVGQALMEALFKLARQRGCSRVEWTTDDDNQGAQTFYDALGQKVHASKIFYRLDGERLSGVTS